MKDRANHCRFGLRLMYRQTEVSPWTEASDPGFVQELLVVSRE